MLHDLYKPSPSSLPKDDRTRLSSIKIYYITVLLILVSLVVIGYSSLRHFMYDHETSLSRLNLIYTQRTLSQQIALIASQLANPVPTTTPSALRGELSDLINQLSSGQMALMDSLQYDSEHLPLPLHSLYFESSPPLSALIDTYLANARQILTLSDGALRSDSADLKALLLTEADVVARLQAIGFQYDLENQRRVAQLGQSEIIFLIVTLVILGLITIFIFLPMERRIQTDQRRLLDEIDMRREVEQTLLRSEALYRLLTQNLPNTAVLLFDLNLRYLLVEGAIVEEAGYSKQNIEGKTIYEVLPSSALQKLLPVYQGALKGLAWDFEYTSTMDKIYRIHSIPVKDDRGEIVGGMLTMLDLTAQKQAEKKLNENQVFMERVLRSSPNLIYIFDVDQQRNVFASRVLGDMLGYTPEQFYEIGGQNLLNIVHPDDQRRLKEQNDDLTRQVETSEALDVEMRLRHASDEWRWFNTRSMVFRRHDDGRVSQMIGVMQDIDERKRTEKMLQEREHVLQQIAAAVPDVIYIYDLQAWSNVYANRPFAASMGYDATTFQALGGDFMSNAMHPEDWARFPQHFAALTVAPTDTVLEFEYRMKSPQGDWIWFNSRDIVFKRDEEGQVTQVLGVARDITTRKKAEQALEESEERFRQIAETVSSAFWIMSADGRETFYVSPAYELIWGRPCMTMYMNPQAFMEVVHPDDLERVVDARSKMLTSGQANIEYRILRPDNSVRWVTSRSYPVINKEGAVERVISVSDDMTERKTLEQQTFTMAVERERIRLLADFVHDTSHDLRTPLTIISTGLYLLRRITDPQKQGERIDLLEKQVQHLDRIIGDLHTMSDLDITPDLELRALDINQLLRDVTLSYSRRSQDKKHTLLLNLQTDLPAIYADPERIKHAFLNLIDNAILYTAPEGCISISTSLTASHVVISVADTGIGIASEHLERIFDRFYKVNFARTSGQGGPGLGLSIVKKIVEMHQGTIEVQSLPGEGSTFCIALPLHASLS